MTDYLQIRKYSGVSTFTSKEDRPVEVLQEAINLRFNHKLGRLVKRLPYANRITAGLTTLKRMIEFKNKNDERLLAVMDGNTLKRSVYSGGYGAIASISNDERTAGSTIDGDNFHPIIINKELRSGAGISASTQRPIWYGYIAERDRYNGNTTISAGKYLDLQVPAEDSDVLAQILKNNSESVVDCELTGAGFALTKVFKFYVSPVYDGYQRGMPVLSGAVDIAVFSGGLSASQATPVFTLKVLDAYLSYGKRITAVDVFVTAGSDSAVDDIGADPAYFLQRIDMDADSDYFLEISGDVGSTTANKIVISDYASWLTFNPNAHWIYDETNGDYYQVTGHTLDAPIAGDITLTVSPNAPSNGTATLKWFSRWTDYTTFWAFDLFYDNHYKSLGSEMYDYLGIPKGDLGLSDFRYKFLAYNGNRALYSGFPNDKNFSYYSASDAPDVVPALNIFRHRADVRGSVSVGREFLVFTDIGTERIAIYADQQANQNDEYLNAVLVNQKAVTKITDNEVAFMSYKGAYVVSNREVMFVGKHLKQWFIGADAKLSQAQKEACVAGFNDENNEVWFSFPTYTTSPFTTGVTMVFDLEAYRGQDLSAWWFVSSDIALKSFALNSDLKMLAGSDTKIVDMDGNGTETVSTSHKLKLLQGAIPNRLVRWGWLHIDAETDDTISVNLYFDGSSTAVSLTMNSDKRGLIAYLKKTLEIEITTAASTNEVEYLGTVLEFQPKVVA